MALKIGTGPLRDYLEAHKDRHLRTIQDFVRQPSVSAEGRGLEECARLVAERFRELGCQEVAVVPTDWYPGVWACLDAGAPKTIASYGMYDVRPANETEWTHPPFEARLVEQPPFRRVMVGRGARGAKGPSLAWLNALEALLAVNGRLPVNIMFLWEGDEILGSPSYRQLFEAYRDRLGTVDACFSPGAGQSASGEVAVTLGYKGLVYMDLVVSGERWGRGPRGKPVHGMAKAVVDSPVWRLAHVLASLTEPDGNHIAVRDFYADCRPPSADEAAAVRRLLEQVGDRPWQSVLPGVAGGGLVSRAIGDETGEALFHSYFFSPSLNVNALAAGHTGPGTMPFTLPHEARCRFDLRLPRGYPAARAIRRIRDHLDERGLADVELRVISAWDPASTDPESDLVRAAVEVLAGYGSPTVIWPFSGGGGPWGLFAGEFGVPVLRDVGLGHGGRTGGPDEYLVIDGNDVVGGLVECELSHAEMLLRYAGA